MGKYAKAVVGAIVAGLGTLQVALGDDVVSTKEYIEVASATLAALGLVWGVQNASPATRIAETDEVE